MPKTPKRCWLSGGVLLLAIFVLAPQLCAQQQPSVELQSLREATRMLYQAGDYASALRKAEEALPVVVREYGAEHEQTLIQYTSLGLFGEKASNLTAAQRYYTESVRIAKRCTGPRVQVSPRGLRT
jgi:hypothetical protein